MRNGAAIPFGRICAIHRIPFLNMKEQKLRGLAKGLHAGDVCQHALRFEAPARRRAALGDVLLAAAGRLRHLIDRAVAVRRKETAAEHDRADIPSIAFLPSTLPVPRLVICSSCFQISVSVQHPRHIVFRHRMAVAFTAPHAHLDFVFPVGISAPSARAEIITTITATYFLGGGSMPSVSTSRAPASDALSGEMTLRPVFCSISILAFLATLPPLAATL